MTQATATTLASEHRPGSSPSGVWHITFTGTLSLVIRLVVGGLFVWAAWNKLQPPNGPQNFADSVRAFKLGLPDWATRLSTSVTPWVEAIAGLLLILGIWVRASALVIGLLLAVFIVLIWSVIARDLNVECGCFGKLSPFCPKRVGMCNIIQNAVMLAGSVYLLLAPRTGICGKR